MVDLFCEKLFSLKPSIVEVGSALITSLSLNVYSEPSQTSKMDLFAKIVND